MLIESCPCCGSRLLHHARNTGSYLRCTSCWLEIPNFVINQAENIKPTASALTKADRATQVTDQIETV